MGWLEAGAHWLIETAAVFTAALWDTLAADYWSVAVAFVTEEEERLRTLRTELEGDGNGERTDTE